MTGAPPLRVCVAQPPWEVDGALTADATAAADIPFRFGDEFPFVDRAVASLDVGTAAIAQDRAGLLQLLLECRRVLAPGARMRIARSADDAACADAAKLAGLAGLAAAPSTEPGTLVFTKPVRLAEGTPLVTIAIPAYNPRYFATAFDSALAQDYPNLEIVIADDARDDAIESMVRARKARVPVHYQRNPELLRPRANYVACFERAQGEYLKFLCDDDVLLPGCVSDLMQAFERVPDLTLATSRRHRIGPDGARLPDDAATLPIVAEDRVVEGRSLANTMLMAGINMIGEPSTVLLRKADLEDQRPDFFNFDGAAGRSVIDIVMWAALLLKGNAAYLVEPRSAFRTHGEQRQHDPAVAARSIESLRELQAKWLGLGLHTARPPDMLLTRPWLAHADDDWSEERVRSFRLRPA